MTTNFRTIKQKVLAVATCLILLAAVLLTLNWHRETVAKQEASERIAAAVQAREDDLALFQAMRQAQQDEFDAQVAAQRAELALEVAGELESARETVNGYKGKLEKKGDFDTFNSRLDALEEELDGHISINTLDRIGTDITKVTKTAKKSHDAYKAEQKRIAEEKARKEAEAAAAAARAAAQAAPPSGGPKSSTGGGRSAPSSGGPKSSTGGGRSAPSSGGGAKPAATGGGNSYVDTIRGVLNRHGCSSAAIKVDDPRIKNNKKGNAAFDWDNNAVLIRSNMGQRVYYLAAHECAHLLQYRVYGGDMGALQADMNRIYGGTGYSGLEQNADCITRRWGYTAYHYTTNCSGARGAAAAAISAGSRP